MEVIRAQIPLNRPTKITYNDGTAPGFVDRTPAVTYCYDAAPTINASGAVTSCGTAPVTGFKGRLTYVGNSVSNTQFLQYSPRGFVQQSSQQTTAASTAYAYPFTYTYNLAGSVSSITYPSGRVVNYSFDTAGRVSVVGGMKGTAST